MCSQKLNVAAVAFDGMVTACKRESVVVLPCPSNQESKVPECGGSLLVLLMIRLVDAVVVTVHGEALPGPFSKPGFPSSCVFPPEALTVNEMVTV